MTIEELPGSSQNFRKLISDIPDEVKNRYALKRLPPKTVVVRKDEKVEHVFMICSGTMHIINEFYSGRIYNFATIGAMDIIGDIEILTENNRYACTVETMTECTVIRMSRADFINTYESSHIFAMEVGRMIARKLYPSSFKIGEIKFYSPHYNFVNFLIEYVQMDIQEGKNVVINLTHQQIEDAVGISIRSVNRIIKKLREENLITIRKGKINLDKNQYLNLLDKREELRNT